MFKSENQKTKATFAGIVLLVIIATLINFGSWYNLNRPEFLPQTKEFPYSLGLDLVGGTHLVYKADVTQVQPGDRTSAIAGVRDVIERRVNAFGVSEPVVQTAEIEGEYRIIVELAGVNDVQEAIDRIGATPLLEFKEEKADTQTDDRALTPEQEAEIKQHNEGAQQRAQEALTKAQAGEDFGTLARTLSEDEATRETGGNLSWITTDSPYPEIVAAIRSLEPGTVVPQLVETDGRFFFQGGDAPGYNVVRLDDKRAQTEGELGLEKKEIKASHLLICYQGATGCATDLSKEQAQARANELKAQATPENFGSLAAQHSTEPGAAERKGDLGWFTREAMVKPFADAVFPAAVGSITGPVETEFGYHLIFKQEERPSYEYNVSRILIEKKTLDTVLGAPSPWESTKLTGEHLERASVQFDPNDNTPQILLEFNSEGEELFREITTRNVNKPVAIFLDGQPISIPTVNQPILSGEAVITGSFTVNEAKELAQNLNAGALPIPIEIVSQQTVGASLGQVSVARSLQAGVIGLALVALFMIAVYRLPGILALISLIVYGLLVLAVFKLGAVTLTLAGIAGFILSIGMAVDANVLIFARLKEELSEGRAMGIAIKESFRRAWPSIRDGNVSTLLTCLILFYFTTGVVKGFAITLGIGVLISMFSAIVVTRALMRITMWEGMEHKWWALGTTNKKEV